MAELPTGTVTFLFTDVEGSTRLWERHPGAMQVATARHDALVEEAVEGNGGVLVRPRGEGDSRFAVFARASDAIAGAAALQVALHAEAWTIPTPLRVRMALHTGEADRRAGDYYGAAVNRCARLRAVAHGGQILVAQTTRDLVRQALPEGVGLRDLGEHRLADLTLSERVFQVTHPALRADFPPLRSLDALPNNLPLQLTSFVGRERDIAQVRERLNATRLLTLTGTGGCGKTRLALKLGELVLDTFADGVWLVELAPLADPGLIPQAVAKAVGVSEVVGRDLTGVLVDALRPLQLLLIVDNCEHLIADCARLVDTLVRGCPSLRVLATSRELLGVPGETVWRVPSLAAPDPRDLSGVADPAELVAQADAVRLLVERARQVVPDFRATPANAAALAQICHRLDGIPLALELAASRLRTISVDQLATRLDNRFRLLTGGSRTALRRQQTLRALVDWSHDLLPAPEQAFFRKLAAFVGGWRIEAAEAVVGDRGRGTGEGERGTEARPVPSPSPVPRPLSPVPREEVLDLLAALADKSLVVVEDSSDTAPRYRLLETLREYALERLVASGEAETARAAHAAYYVALARDLSAAQLAGELYFRGRFGEELDNFRAALRWSAGAARWDDCLDLIGSLSAFWAFGGYSGESVPWVRLALEHLDDGGPERRSRLLAGLAALAFVRGDFATAESAARESIAIRPDPEAPYIVGSPILLGIVLRDQERYDEARAILEEVVRLGHAAGDPRRVSGGLFQLGLLARQEGNLPRAEAILTEGLELGRKIGWSERWGGPWVYNLGLVAEDAGDFRRARDFYAQSIPLLRAAGDQWHLPYVLEGFATVAARQEKAERVLVLAGAAASARERFGNPIPPPMKARLEQAVARARHDRGEAADGAWARGQAMSLERAVGYALDEDVP